MKVPFSRPLPAVVVKWFGEEEVAPGAKAVDLLKVTCHR